MRLLEATIYLYVVAVQTLPKIAIAPLVDDPKDYELVSIIYETLYPENPSFSTADILKSLDERPELKSWNTEHQRNEGFLKSLEADLSQNVNQTN